MYNFTGVPYVARKMMAASTPIVEISCEDDTWTIKTSTLIRTTELKFKTGEEYVETMPSGEVLNVGNFILIHEAEDHSTYRLSSCRLDFRSSISTLALEFFLFSTLLTVLTAMFYGLYHLFQADRYVRAPPFMKLAK
jgi:hypothetical protein